MRGSIGSEAPPFLEVGEGFAVLRRAGNWTNPSGLGY